MRCIRAVGLGAAVAITLGGFAAASALAAPEFLHEGKEVVHKGITVKSKIGVISTIYIVVGETKFKITCTSATGAGKLKGTKEVEAVVLKFNGCRGKESEEAKQCEVNSISPAGGKEEIITKTLKGRLGAVAASEAVSERGLLLEATTGTVFATILSSSECLPAETTEVKGGLMSEIKPVKVLKLKGELAFNTKEMKTQMIKKFTGETPTHELEVYGVKTPLETLTSTEFEETVEVT